MSRTTVVARRLVEEYGRDGRLAEASLAAAEFGVWDRVTPGGVLIGAFTLLSLEDPGFVESLRGPGVDVLVAMMKDDRTFRALELTDAGADFGWDALVSVLWAYGRSGGADRAALDALLERAGDFSALIVEEREASRPRVRDRENGPWDASEIPVPEDIRRVDYGVMKVPVLEGARSRPMREGEHIVGVIMEFGDNIFCLQVYRAPGGPEWASAHMGLARNARTGGGTAIVAESSLGPEVRAEIPGMRDGHAITHHTRFVGCDGPGWMLRGIHHAPADLSIAEVVEPRVHHLFTQTVVELPPADAASITGTTIVEVRWPGAEPGKP